MLLIKFSFQLRSQTSRQSILIRLISGYFLTASGLLTDYFLCCFLDNCNIENNIYNTYGRGQVYIWKQLPEPRPAGSSFIPLTQGKTETDTYPPNLKFDFNSNLINFSMFDFSLRSIPILLSSNSKLFKIIYIILKSYKIIQNPCQNKLLLLIRIQPF